MLRAIKNILFILFFVFKLPVFSQELFTTAGESVSNSIGVFEFAIGDVIVESAANSNFQIFQGFHQPRVVIPVADFSVDATTICVGNTVSFSDNSTGYPTYWSWDFGDGNTSNLQSPSHTYNSGGVYDVKLVVSNSSSSDSITKIGHVTVNGDASFSYSSNMFCSDGVDPLPTITGTLGGVFSSTTGLVINQTSGLIDISASTSGVYTVTYTTSSAGCSDSDTWTINLKTFGNVYVDDFESQGGWTGDFGNTNGLWGINSGQTTSLSTGPSSAHSGNNYFYFETSAGGLNSGSIYSPAIDLTSITTYTELSFWLHAYGSNIGSFSVEIGNSLSGSFTSVYSISGQQNSSMNSPFQNVAIDISSFTGRIIYVKLTYNRASGGVTWRGDLAVDLMKVNSCVTCPSPSSLSFSNVTANSVDLNWTPGGSETQWNLEYGLKGFSLGAGTSVTVNTNSHSISGLNPSTEYSYYVRANCISNQSFWMGPYVFQTSVSPPSGVICSSSTGSYFFEDDLTSSSGWTTTGSGWNMPATSGNSNNSGPSGAFSGSTYAEFDAPTFAYRTGTLTSPIID